MIVSTIQQKPFSFYKKKEVEEGGRGKK